MSRNTTLVPVTTTSWGLEYSVHECPRRHRDDVGAIFPGVSMDDMLIIPTCQQSNIDLVNWGEKADNEKDRLLEQLSSRGYWADYIDPCSGLPMIHRECGSVYGEVEGLVTLLGYRTQNAGCCKIVLHPKWGSSVYPASMFAKAPIAEVHQAILFAEKQLEKTMTNTS